MSISDEIKSVKAKSASTISRQTTAAAVRSLTSTSLKRNKKSAEQEKSEVKVENTSLILKKDLKEIFSTNNGKKRSSYPSKCARVEKKREKNNENIQSAKPKTLKPVTTKLEKNKIESVVKENAQNRSKLRETQKLNPEITQDGLKLKNGESLASQEDIQGKKPEISTNSKEPSSDSNAKKTKGDEEKVNNEGSNKKMNAKDDCETEEKRSSEMTVKDVNNDKECKLL